MNKFIALLIGLLAISHSYAANSSSYGRVSAVKSRSKATSPANKSSTKASQAGLISTYSPEVKRNRIYVDAAYLLAKGVGVGYEYSVADQLSVGPFFNYFVLDNSKSDKSIYFVDYDLEHEIKQYGLKGRLFLSDKSYQKGAYLLGAVMQVQADSKARYPGLYQGTASIDKTGYLVGAGFQFDMAEANASKFIVDLAAIYGTGFQMETRTSSNLSMQTNLNEVQMKEHIFLELSIGMLF